VLTGYKLFARKLYADSKPIAGRYYFRYFTHNSSQIVATNRWLTANTESIRGNTGPEWYKSGFHIYTDKKYAKNIAEWSNGIFEVVEVQYYGVLARGKEITVPVVVAKHMRVPYKKKRSSYGK
jgi:hypothetical protein